MKIGITTYFNIKNYGSALQAFALKIVLSHYGYTAEFLNVKETSFADKFLHKLHVAGVTSLKCLFSKEAAKVQKEIFTLKKNSVKEITPKTEASFIKFQEKNLPSITIGRRKLKKVAHSDKYAAFICGSDQIWSPLSPHMSGYKFLSFAPKEKRIAYAPSFGVSNIPTYNRKFIANSLKQMKHISVREYDGAEIVNNLIGKKPSVVLDPTMLITGEEWRNMYREKASNLSGNYILCYFFEEPNEKTAQKICSFAKENNLKVVVLFAGNQNFIKNGAEVVSAGPWDFLALVDNAQYVFTNSFHGCAFSVLFEKKFIVFNRGHSDSVKQTSRINTLLNLIGAEKSFYNEDDQEFSFPNVDLYDENILKQREFSLDYLKNSLKGCN